MLVTGKVYKIEEDNAEIEMLDEKRYAIRRFSADGVLQNEEFWTCEGGKSVYAGMSVPSTVVN